MDVQRLKNILDLMDDCAQVKFEYKVLSEYGEYEYVYMNEDIIGARKESGEIVLLGESCNKHE